MSIRVCPHVRACGTYSTCVCVCVCVCAHRGGHTSHKDDRDLETFDDGEFYQQLLKEFLEYSGNAGNGLATVRPAKKRKLVDRKASKGRKIRYVYVCTH